jgi:hypothetical protein
MREFGAPVGAEVRSEILRAAEAFYAGVEKKRDVTAAEFAMEDAPERVVVHEAELRWDGERMRVAATEPAARPPFEWLYEITSDVGEADYFKHYLIREHDVVLAQRKVLTPIDAQEAELILRDLQAAQNAIVGQSAES